MAWRWTHKRTLAAQMLAEGQGQRATARALGIAERTLRYWAAKPEFQERLRELEGEAHKRALRVLQRRGVAAAERLVMLMDRGKTGDHVKLRAATEILDRIGVVPVTKIAPTDPSGENPYVGLSDDELIAAIAAEYARLHQNSEAADGGPVSLDAEGAGESAGASG